jgi:hypothetical protein
MAKAEKTVIDWTKPIEHVEARIKVKYDRTLETGDEFRHLVLREGGAPLLVDDCGCIRAKAPVNKIQRVRNVVEKVAELPKPRAPTTREEVIVELTTALENLHGEVPSLREVIARATAALVKVAEEGTKNAASFAAAVVDLRKLAAEQQTAYMNANMMLLEELRKLPDPKPVAVEARPAPTAIARPKPIVVKSLPVAAEIKNLDHLGSGEVRETIRTLSLVEGVKKIIVAGYGSCSAGKNGQLKYCGEEGNALKVKAFGFNYVHDVFVFCRKEDHSIIIKMIEYLGKENVASAK